MMLDMLQDRLAQERGIREPELAVQGEARSNYSGLQDIAKKLRWKRLLSNDEWRLFSAKLSSWSMQDLLKMNWRRESLGVLAWALRRFESLAPYDQEFELPEASMVDFLAPAIEKRTAELRSVAEIDLARDNAEMWHWRSRTARLIKQGHQLPPGQSFEQIVGMVANGSKERGWMDSTIDNDFPAFGKPYRDLTDEEYNYVTSISMERHYALNWLCGYARDWDKVPTGT